MSWTSRQNDIKTKLFKNARNSNHEFGDPIDKLFYSDGMGLRLNFSKAEIYLLSREYYEKYGNDGIKNNLDSELKDIAVTGYQGVKYNNDGTAKVSPGEEAKKILAEIPREKESGFSIADILKWGSAITAGVAGLYLFSSLFNKDK